MNYTPNNLRPVQINFELYIDSDDIDFKLELILLMINNLEELKGVAKQAWDNRDVNIFNACTHKTKSTVSLLDDGDLNDALEQMKNCLSTNAEESTSLNHLHTLCDSIIASLEHEVIMLKAQQ